MHKSSYCNFLFKVRRWAHLFKCAIQCWICAGYKMGKRMIWLEYHFLKNEMCLSFLRVLNTPFLSTVFTLAHYQHQWLINGLFTKMHFLSFLVLKKKSRGQEKKSQTYVFHLKSMIKKLKNSNQRKKLFYFNTLEGFSELHYFHSLFAWII